MHGELSCDQAFFFGKASDERKKGAKDRIIASLR